MDNEAFYEQRNFDEYNMNREPWSENTPARSLRRDDRNISNRYDNDIDGEPLDPARTFDSAHGVSVFGYDHAVGTSGERRGARWRDPSGQLPADDFAGSRDRQTQSARAPRQDDKHSSKYRDYGEDIDRKSRSRGHGYGTEDSSGRGRQRSKSRERDRIRDSRDRERSKDRDRRSRRDGGENSYGNERDDSEYRSRRRSRSRDRDRDRRYRDSDRDRRRRDSDRDRHRRERDRDRESSPKDVPWVPPPLPEHLRHLQVQYALTPGAGNQQASSSAGILGAPPPLRPTVQNQFQNDGSFMEMFRQKMQQQQQAAPVSDDSNTCEGPTVSNTGAVMEEVSTATVPPPTLPANSSGVPVIAKRRISKILKTGIVQKKKKEEEEEPDKDADGWSSYMKEVQKYRANKCIENEASRPPLVK